MDCLTHLTDDLEEVETKVEAIFQYVAHEPPEIVIENLSLIKSLLSNCRSHIQLRKIVWLSYSFNFDIDRTK